MLARQSIQAGPAKQIDVGGDGDDDDDDDHGGGGGGGGILDCVGGLAIHLGT